MKLFNSKDIPWQDYPKNYIKLEIDIIVTKAMIVFYTL